MRAETNTASGRARRNCARPSPVAASVLLTTNSSGGRERISYSATTSVTTWRTALTCASWIGIRTVDHVDQQFGVDDLLECGPERLDQLVGKVAHEPDGVGEHERPTVVEMTTAGRGFESGEQRILDEDPRPGEGVEQAGLARVGVADDGGSTPRRCATSAPRWVSRIFFMSLISRRQLGHSLANAAAVGLDLGLAGTAGAHSPATAACATALTRHRLTPAAEPRQHVLHLGEGDLRLALRRGGVLGEDVQDQGGPGRRP